jgi:hypothetical protein
MVMDARAWPDIKEKRIDPLERGYAGLGHESTRAARDRCWSLYASMPWLGFGDALKSSARSAFVFALSVCQMPKPAGSIGALLDQAFPRGSLRSAEGALFVGLTQAARAMGCSRFDFGDDSAERACALAPLFFGGLSWLESEPKARASRLIFCQALADSCASRAFFDARALQPAPLAGIECFELALESCLAAEWSGPEILLELSSKHLGAGSASDWPAAHAARERLALHEKKELLDLCPHARATRDASNARL